MNNQDFSEKCILLKTSVKCKELNGIIAQDKTRQTNLTMALIHIQLGGILQIVP